MKKLVCARDIEECSKQGKTEYCVDGDTIITPSAKDAAEACGIRFTDRISQPEAVCANAFAGMDKMDAAGLCQLLKTYWSRAVYRRRLSLMKRSATEMA